MARYTFIFEYSYYETLNCVADVVFMAAGYDIEAKVINQKGFCEEGHKVGDSVYFDGKTVKGNICYDALLVLLPKVYALRYGLVFPWATDKNKDICLLACPDCENPVVFELRRIRKKNNR